MYGRFIRIGALAFALALVAAIASAPQGWDYFRFQIGNYDRAAERKAVEDTIKLFSASMAGLYATGGNPGGLNQFPATMLIKRKVLIDTNNMRTAGKVLVIDRDRSDVKEVRFIDREHALAIVQENWFNQVQDLATRRPLARKTNFITVRYYLKKAWSKWIVVEYEVYGREDSIPPVSRERVLKW